MLSPREAICTLPTYHPPLAGRNGLRLDFNENTVGCSPHVIERLRTIGLEDLARYPEREPVEATVAEFLDVATDEVLLTNGVDEAIHLLCQTYLAPGNEALIVIPTYSMYRIYMMAAGAELVTIPAEKDFQFPLSAVLERITPRTRMIAIANPNNPTGAVVPPEQLEQIAFSAPYAAFLVDEAYFEFYDKTMIPRHRELPNLFVARTFSKTYGLAGLRLGVLVGDSEPMRSVRRVCSPYNVNAIALACLPTALADQDYIDQYRSEVIASRGRLEQFFHEREIPFWPSQANFVLAHVGSTANEAAVFVEQMRQRGILTRDRSADHGCEGCVRFTLGPAPHADRLLATLQEVLEKLGIAHGACS